MDLQIVLDRYACAVYILTLLHNKGSKRNEQTSRDSITGIKL